VGRYLHRHEDIDDEDDEMGHFYTGNCDTSEVKIAFIIAPKETM